MLDIGFNKYRDNIRTDRCITDKKLAHLTTAKRCARVAIDETPSNFVFKLITLTVETLSYFAVKIA